MSKNVFITGINKGLGKELFELFLTKGYTVYGLLRNQLVAEKLKSNLPENGKLILADLSTDESINAIQKVVIENPIPVLCTTTTPQISYIEYQGVTN
jgi:short-subunit dehydrogenase